MKCFLRLTRRSVSHPPTTLCQVFLENNKKMNIFTSPPCFFSCWVQQQWRISCRMGYHRLLSNWLKLASKCGCWLVTNKVRVTFSLCCICPFCNPAIYCAKQRLHRCHTHDRFIGTETAENIGYSCNMLREEMKDIFIVAANTAEGVKEELQ